MFSLKSVAAAAAAAVAGALIACLARGPSAPTESAGPLIVTPPTASVAVGDTIMLSVGGVSSDARAPGPAIAVTWASSDTGVASVSPTGVVTGVAPGTATITASSGGRTGAAAIIVAPRPLPGAVADLVVDSVSDSSVVLRFTDVDDGRGRPAAYDVRYAPPPIAWGTATIISRGSCATPVFGVAVGATHRCAVLGLAAGADYDFQLVAFRGTLNRNAVFGELSNVATATTAASTAPVASVVVAPESATVVVGRTQQLTVTLKDTRGRVVRGRPVAWASKDTSVASVSSTGLVTAVALGSTTISATSEGKNGSATITVVASPPPVTYYRTSFNDGTTGPLDVYSTGGGSCTKSTDYRDPGSAFSIKCTIPTGTGAAALQAWFGNGQLSGFPKDPSLDDDLFEHVRFVLGPGAGAAIGGTACTAQNSSSQFKVHKSVYGQVGSAWNGWIMSEIAPCTDPTHGRLFSAAEMWTINGSDHVWPDSLAEGVVYEVVYRYHRYTAQNCGTIAVWVNGAQVLNSPCWPYMGTTNGSGQGLLFWDGATYLQNSVAPLVVYNLFAEATNYPVGGATSSP